VWFGRMRRVRNGIERSSRLRDESGRTRRLEQEAEIDKQKAGFKGKRDGWGEWFGMKEFMAA
jgi:hypothetical protein